MVAKGIVPKLRFRVFMENWQKSPINEITSYVDYRGKTPAKTDSGIFLVTAKNIRMGFIDYKSSEEFIAKSDYENVMSRGKPAIGDVLITTEAPMGNIASVDRVDIALAQRVIKLRGIKSVIDNEFLRYRLQSKQFQDELNSKSSGGTVKGIKGSVLHKINVAFPALEEQTKIANFLAAVDAKISQLTKKHELLSSYKKGVMQKIFSQELRFKDDEGREFAEWKLTTIGEIANKVIAGGTPSTLKKEYWGGNIRWMNSGELNLKLVVEVENRITQAGLENSSTKLIPKNCVLIGLAGQGKTRGTVAMNLVELCTNQSIAAILPNPKTFDSHYLCQNLEARYDELRSLSAGDGGRGGLNLQIIKSMEINLPCLQEQAKIANFLTAIDDKITNVKSQLEATKKYKQGLLQQMFV